MRSVEPALAAWLQRRAWRSTPRCSPARARHPGKDELASIGDLARIDLRFAARRDAQKRNSLDELAHDRWVGRRCENAQRRP
jgi:hypothetical protein